MVAKLRMGYSFWLVQEVLNAFRARARERRGPDDALTAQTWGQSAADAVASVVGSWRFVLVQSALLAAWLVSAGFPAALVGPVALVISTDQADALAKRFGDQVRAIESDRDLTVLVLGRAEQSTAR